MKINFMPKTVMGWWSFGLIIAFFLSFAFFLLIVASGQRGGQTFFSNPWLAFSGISAAVFAISSFFVGIFSIVKNKERGVLVFLSTVIGFFVLLFVLGEILSPH